jgi:hypothetical protein
VTHADNDIGARAQFQNIDGEATMREWTYPSLGGLFRIKEAEGLFQLLFDGKALGIYHSAEQLLNNLLGGHCDAPSAGYPERFDVPDDIGEWPLQRC